MLGHRRGAIPERPNRVDRTHLFRLAELGTHGLHDFAVARLQSPAEFAHARLVAEQSHHPLVFCDRSLVDLEPVVKRDAHPGIDRPVDLPVGDDTVAMRRPGSDGPAESMAQG